MVYDIPIDEIVKDAKRFGKEKGKLVVLVGGNEESKSIVENFFAKKGFLENKDFIYKEKTSNIEGNSYNIYLDSIKLDLRGANILYP